jgi:hypothetical protein
MTKHPSATSKATAHGYIVLTAIGIEATMPTGIAAAQTDDTVFAPLAHLPTNPKVGSHGLTNIAAHTNQAYSAMHARGLGTTPLTAICWRSPSTLIDIPRTSPLTNALPLNLAGSRNMAKLGQPARTPRQVMQTYCNNYNITPDHLDQAMDWECWPNLDHDDLNLE